MIKINNKSFEINHFPDNTQLLKGNFDPNNPINIFWSYESDEELVTLMFIVKHIRNAFSQTVEINLTMPYIPNARMDRTHNKEEFFTLKYFADIINSLGFNKVVTMDAHSNVSGALFDRIENHGIENPIKNVLKLINKLRGTTMYVYFPDDGAYKRYKDLNVFEGCKFIYGRKRRNWDTGIIEGLDIVNEKGEILTKLDNDAVVLMVDDIVSYGGIMAYSADKLKESGAASIYAYATHVENSVLNAERGTLIKRINSGIVKCLYTTNSIFTKTDETKKIKIIYELGGTDNKKFIRPTFGNGIIKIIKTSTF